MSCSHFPPWTSRRCKMHIKQVTISNFRSFQTQEEIDPLSPHTNAIVGRNGSGKSNFFDAVQFVLLAPRFANLRQDERQAILHEGSGAAAVNAFVEIIFDNSDQRFALEASDEVVLRRTIGLKKDEFFLNRKKATKSEVQSLLEGAGFSKSNPYFIVQQGKVQDLCTMSDKDRLVLLKEVAGTTVYDEKKKESLARMRDNADSIEKIEDILSDINERLEELQSEKEELTNYQQLDRQRRAIEYTLYDKELRKARHSLDSIEHDRAEHVQVISEYHQAAKETHDSIQEVESVIKAKTNVLRRNKMQLEGLKQDANDAVTLVTRLQLDVNETNMTLENLKEQSQANQKELMRVEKEISEAKTKLEEVVDPAYEQAVKDLQELTDRRDQSKSQIDALYAKQGRGKQFSTKEERDAFLQESIQELRTTKQAKEDQLGKQQDALSNLRRTIQKEAQEIDKLNRDVTDKENALQGLLKSIDQKKKERLEVVDRRKQDQRRTEELREQVREARENFHRASSNFRKVMPRATADGLEALKSIVEKERLTGDQYFGMLMDNFTLQNETYQDCVDVAAQNSLFHVIVDTDDTAALLMKRLEDGKLGRVTFLPLNQLMVESVQYPESSDVRPLISLCLNYDKKVEKAMKHVFNKKLLARSAEVAAEWSARAKMDAITLEGDLCSRKGAMTGGYVDASKSRLRAYSAKKATQDTLRTLDREYETLKRQTQQADHDATKVMSELQRLESKHAELSNMALEKETSKERLTSRLDNQKNQCGKLEKESIPFLEKEVASVEAEILRLEEEIGSDLVESLTDAERKLINDLKKVQAELVPEIDAQTEKVAMASVERQKLSSLLHDNLLKRRRELTEASNIEQGGNRRMSRGALSSAALQQEHEGYLKEQEREFDQAIGIKDDVTARVEKAQEEMQVLQDGLVKAKNELEQLKSGDMKNRSNLEEANEKAEKLLSKRSIYMSKRDTYMRKIAELGSLPPPTELVKYSSKSINELMKSLESVNKTLKKYSHVNKKAFDQYVNFNEQRDQLLSRKDELDKEAKKVNELMESLDLQKDEAINRTFRGASMHFKEVFGELVPQGAGELIMRTAIDEGLAGDDDDGEITDSEGSIDVPTPKKSKGTIDSKNPDVSLYRGIGINVRFSSIGENYIMSQLSGGQKALVAMALIFAIQRCDPAPFYLFDELDQALDSTYRSAVARMIKKQSSDKENPTQFIVSTFRPELVETAAKCYGISLQSKVSSVHVMPKKDALHFIANLMHDEEAVGEVTSVRTSKGSTIGSRKRKTVVEEEESVESEKEDVQSASGNDDMSADEST
ncbi:hypothetical protein MPSEU_000111300 [Mayamaea pseudoterrestris]|nr:hypothetical protein MPSEU_000111300 [Mayamaea pseudoterrestris]